MNKTNIEWVKNPPPPHIKVDATGRWHDPTGKFAEQPGYTWNPITGCLNGCPYCYARKLANGRLKERYLANKDVASYDPYHPRRQEDKLTAPFYPRFWEDRLGEPITDISWTQHRQFGDFAKTKGIFVCNMGELFGDWLPKGWQNAVFETINACPQHRFYLLTKQPQNLPQWSPFPDNCWVGVTATANAFLSNALIGLRSIEAKVKFISFEPLLGDVGMNDHMKLPDAGVGWVIIGAQTKPYKPPKIEWVEEIVRACDKAGVPVFLKDNLKPLLKNKDGWTPALFVNARTSSGIEYLRQEMPNA